MKNKAYRSLEVDSSLRKCMMTRFSKAHRGEIVTDFSRPDLVSIEETQKEVSWIISGKWLHSRNKTTLFTPPAPTNMDHMSRFGVRDLWGSHVPLNNNTSCWARSLFAFWALTGVLFRLLQRVNTKMGLFPVLDRPKGLLNPFFTRHP